MARILSAPSCTLFPSPFSPPPSHPLSKFFKFSVHPPIYLPSHPRPPSLPPYPPPPPHPLPRPQILVILQILPFLLLPPLSPLHYPPCPLPTPSLSSPTPQRSPPNHNTALCFPLLTSQNTFFLYNTQIFFFFFIPT